MGISDDDLKAIEARANAATPGPWRVTNPRLNRHEIRSSDNTDVALIKYHGDKVSIPNANLIAHARTDIPALIADLRASREALRDVLNDAAKSIDLRLLDQTEPSFVTGTAWSMVLSRVTLTKARKALGEE